MGLNSVIECIYEATLQPRLWQTVLEEIRQTIFAQHAVISIYDTYDAANHRVMTAGATLDQEQTYLADYIESDAVWLRKLFDSVPEGSAINSTDFERLSGMNRRQLMGKHFDFFELVNMTNHVFSLPIHTADRLSAFSIHRSSHDPPFNKADTHTIENISSHLRRALRIHFQLNISGRGLYIDDQCRNIASKGFLLVDHRLDIKYANSEASRLLNCQRTIRISPDGLLQASNNHDHTLLHSLVLDTLKNRTCPQEPIAIGLRTLDHPLKVCAVKVLPLQREVGLLLVDAGRKLQISRPFLKQAYSLTESEIDVVLLLINGHQIHDIASARATSDSTARWQLKCLMQKTRTRSQAALMRLLVALAD